MMKILYFNEVFRFDEDHQYLRVIYNEEGNELHLVWWHNDEFKHKGTIGQWKIKYER
jgi:hypothetical protein